MDMTAEKTLAIAHFRSSEDWQYTLALLKIAFLKTGNTDVYNTAARMPN
jgi:hypothetical protein